jgi:selenide,water dikinase
MAHAAVAPGIRDIVLLGCGHAHVTVLREFGRRPLPGVRLTLVTPGRKTPYSGMLHGVIAGHYRHDDMHIDVVRLAEFAKARLVLAAAERLDLPRRRVFCGDRPPVSYDLLSLDTGATPDLAAIPGAADHAMSVKPIGELLGRWAALEQRLAGHSRPVSLGIIGAGAAGVELAFSLRHRLAERISVALLGKEATVVPGLTPRAQARIKARLEARGIALHLGLPVVRISPEGVQREGLPPLQFDEVLVATPVVGPPWVAASGLATDAGGFVRVDDRLRSISHPEVFAAGDVATMEAHPRAKAGVVAVRSGPPLAGNLRRVATSRPPRRFVPQRSWLSLISTGDRAAFAVWGPFCLEGRWVWHWKDWIDRRFMRRFNQPGR